MKNNGGASNYLKAKAQQIKVNRKALNNNGQNINQPILSQNFYQQRQNKLIIQEENKNIKIPEYIDNNTYGNKNAFTEYNSSSKYSIYPLNSLNSYKPNKLLPNEAKRIYNNTNGNINKEKNLNLKNKNKLNINLNKEKKLYKNYTNRDFGKTRKLTSFKGTKKLNANNKNLFQQQNLYGKKSDTQYPLNLTNQINKNKYQSYNNKNDTNKDNEINSKNKGIFNINFDSQKMPNKNEKIKKYHIISPPCTSHNPKIKRLVRQNKNNLSYKRKNNTIISPESININYLPTMKNSNSNDYYKDQNHNITTYNSCYNFYQKTINNNLPKKNNINMLNTINNFGYLNINSSIERNSNKINNTLYEQINNNEEDIYPNDNGYINISEQDFPKSINKNCILNNNIKNCVNINNLRHKKGKLSENNLNLYNSRRNQALNINDTRFIKYKKEIIEKFCHCLEEFIFMNVKNNYDYFILKLNNYCKDKHFNYLLLKRLQNKNIQKNYYKEKAASYKYLESNTTNPHYSSIIMMNNSNIINFQRKGDYISNDFTKDFCGRKTVNNFRNTRSPPLSEKMDRIQKNYRFGQSNEPIDINNIDVYNYYSNNTYIHNNNLLEDYNNFNNYNASNYNSKNIFDAMNNLNEYDDEEKKSVIKYETNFNDNNNNNLYIPKKLKKVNNNNKIVSKSNEKQKKVKNDSDNSNPYINKMKAKKILAKKLSPQNLINRSHDLNNDNTRTKMSKNYYMNSLRKYNSINSSNYQDISCDMNLNSNYTIKKDNEILNKTNDAIIKRNNTELNPRNTYDYKTNDNLPIYKKKIKITQAKSKIFMNKAEPNNIRNKMIKLNCANKTCEQILSPNLDKKNNKNLISNINENLEKNIVSNLTNTKNVNKLRSAFTEPRREINNNIKNIEQNKFNNKIQELTVNLSLNESNLPNKENQLNTNSNNDNISCKKEEVKVNNNNNILIHENEPLNETTNENENTDKKKEKEKENNENKNNKENNKNNINNNNENNTNENENENNNENNNTETITITNNNDNNDYIAISNDNNIINDDTDESDDNITKEIIVKDVSTRDKRLNVFIKYVELSEFNTINNEFSDLHLFNPFQTDSIYFPSLYQRHNRNYYEKYYYGNQNGKNNKLKLHQILSSIIEEEEKSKAAGSINNSLLSEESNKNGNNYSHFFIQSVKYVSNYLQSIFDDKKKDIYFQFLKILKKIKNESFLRGLINQKKYQTLNKLKEEEKESKTEENNSEDIILYNDNDISTINKKKKESENNIKRENSESVKNDEDNSANKISEISNKKYFSENLNKLKRNKSVYPLEHIDIETNKSISYFDVNKEKMNIIIYYNKLKQIVENIEEYKNWKLIETFFKFWKKGKNEKKENEEISFSEKREYSDIQIDYEKNVTISEACRGLSDVILDFKLFLIKYSLKNKKGKS